VSVPDLTVLASASSRKRTYVAAGSECSGNGSVVSRAPSARPPRHR
jgi:hypothetical protein